MQRFRLLAILIAVLTTGTWLWSKFGRTSVEGIAIPYSEFRNRVVKGEMEQITITKENVRGKRKDTAGEWTANIPEHANEELVAFLDEHHAVFRVEHDTINRDWVMTGLSALSLFGLMFVTFRLDRRMGGPKSFRKAATSHTTFADVAGCDEAKLELQETVTYLKGPERAARLGAQNPRGILLCGPPGTGKTLLARAVAGEAGVPFYSVSGSEFVELFVGAGAARVRKLFHTAKRHAPAIIFIDEIDAVGGHRGKRNDHSEREQTLNQILVEMDGFERTAGLIVMAATNRADDLDAALVRKGRFDRRIMVDHPDVHARHAILALHAKTRTMDTAVDLHALAQQLSGFSGADLANVINEGALIATRSTAPAITQIHLQEAIERVLTGAERKTRRLRPEERTRVALHEAGHAIVRSITSGPDSVQKISIVPRGDALGVTIQIPPEDRYIMTDQEILDGIAGLLGGRAAEATALEGSISTGASDDLMQANAAARKFVTIYGMSAHLRHRAFEQVDAAGTFERRTSISEDLIAKVDVAIQEIITDAYARAVDIQVTNTELLQEIAQHLLAQEHLSGAALHELLARAKAPPMSTSNLKRNGGHPVSPAASLAHATA